ncbi:trypsin-like peptidase domain-containing protein [Streptomyces europaeiscabiei]|uniref:trypsin-like peptidase domain-containing protein n=1 Tax=Streptomyces europaeiscabiei TaxID=146819 RepID=UPI000E67F805|nr:trypsin-like peptidase domain-containing protein [Streptomyces europaeiscabiei]
MTANAEQGLRPERVAEIIVALSEATAGRRGSGYLVSPGRVLTAAHVVAGATDVRVRFQADRPGERTVEASVVWRHEGIDIAVLALPDDGMALEPVPYGRVGEHDAVLRCTALGSPRFKLRTDGDGSRFRDAEHVHATCAVLSNRREGTLDLCVASPPADDPDPERDAWEGMSGAAVFAGGRLVGVVTRHHRPDGPGRIAASRVDRWAERLSAAELDSLQRELGCRLHPGALPDTVRATALDLVQEAYREQLAEIAPPEALSDRQSELRDLVEFCGGFTQYLWLQGPPWAGKTALAAWFALHPPRGIVPVWFFVTARYAGQSDGDAYAWAVTDQLAAIAGREPTRPTSPAARDGERRLLLREAAERVDQDGGTLLLVVDGLDEDQSREPGGSGTSIAALLPERLPPNVRVLVTSRPSPDIPTDVKGGHPLRGCQVVKLDTVEAARHSEYEAKYDLQRAFTGDQVERDLVGLLTAARGTLSVDDLRELTGEPRPTLNHRLGSVFGRILRLRGSGGADSSGGGDVTMYMTSRGYLFAHETLLKAAENELGPDVEAYRKRVHAWAETYERRGWPEDTPPYLLQPYGRLVALLGDTSRATALATDARRRDRLREVTGSDAACLAEIAAAREAVRRGTLDDLGALAVLAVVEDMVARRNKSLHPDIPAVYARLGRVRQAIGLARSVYRPMDRARAVAGVAHVLTESGDRRAVGLAEEAVRLAEGAPRRRMPYAEADTMAVRGTLAIALARAGRPDAAVRGLRELPRPRKDSAVKAYGNALIKTAETLGDAESAAVLLRKAEETAGWFDFALDRACGLAHVAEAYSALGFAEDTARLYESACELARGQGEGSQHLSEIAADLRASFPDEAKALALLAAKALDIDGRPVHGEDTHRAVMALVAMERMAGAHRHAQTMGGGDRLSVEDWPSDIWSLVVEGAARRGAVVEAWAALETWSVLALPHGHRPTARVIELLTGAGAATEVEALLLDRADDARVSVPREDRVEEALAALAGHFAADDPQRSLALLHKAEHGHASAAGPDALFASERLAAFVGALATVDRPDDVEQLLGTIDEPHVRAWGCAAVSLALAGRDTDQALTFAVHAVELGRTIEDPDLCSEPFTAAIQALGWAGAARQVVEVFAEFTERAGAGLLPFAGDLALTETIAGLWQHDPGLAGRLADDVLLRVSGHDVARAARFLVAVRPHDEERAARIERLSFDTRAEQPLRWNFGYGDEILLSLLIAANDPVAAKARLDEMVASPELSEGPFSQSMGGAALVYAALGDDETARSIARRTTDEARSAETFAQLAAYAACLPADRVPVPLVENSLDITVLARRLAGLLLPPSPGPDLPKARALLTEALTPAGWHHALPVLAGIDPDAVLRVRDVVFAHLGLSD